MQDLSSCHHAKTLISTTVSGVYTLRISSTNYDVWCEMVGTHGWTLMLKADGTDSTWAYDSATWTDAASTVNPTEYINGLAQTSFKSELHSRLAFSNIRIGMKT